VSRHVTNLERELGVTLLPRTARTTRLTDGFRRASVPAFTAGRELSAGEW
jgi:DNA-binding transcriptional LysR family regulator